MNALKFCILTAFVLQYCTLSSQEYVPFPTDSATWIDGSEFSFFGSDEWVYSEYQMAGDTIINGVSYTKIYLTLDELFSTEFSTDLDSPFLIGGIRETQDRKIYFKPDTVLTSLSWEGFYEPILFADTIEHLVYDFENMNIGDTIVYESVSTDYNNASEIIIEDIDSVLVGGTYRKRYVVYDFLDYNGDETSYIIEGIGSSRGLLAPFERYGFAYNKSALTCFLHNDLIFENQTDGEVLGCNFVVTFINELDENYWTVYPNPVKDVFLLETNSSENFSVEILNSSGKSIVKLMNQAKSATFNTSELVSGSYILRVGTKNSMLIERFIKL